jgi:hypothetical protein
MIFLLRRILSASWFLLVSTTSYTQITHAVTLPIAANTRKITYTQEVAVAHVSQAELYTRAKAWVAASQTITHAVLQTARPATGLLVARARMAFAMVRPGRVVQQPIWYTITVQVNEGRYRYVLCDYQLDLAGKLRPLESRIAPDMPPQERQANETRLMPVSLISKQVIILLQYAMQKPVCRL